ncbi:hypothetical protein BCR43DRAFT_500020, partial [Syncephalastrum racemosum]
MITSILLSQAYIGVLRCLQDAALKGDQWLSQFLARYFLVQSDLADGLFLRLLATADADVISGTVPMV